MDIASVLGFLLAVIFMAVSVGMGGGSLGAFIDPASIMVTVGGSLATLMICFPLKALFRAPQVTKKVFLNKPPNLQELVELLISLAESARRDGLLSLERRLAEIDNKFIVLGLQMTVDGTDPQVIEDVLRTEMEATSTRNREGKALFDQWGKMAPSFGMIGTLLGLILMLGNLSDPDALGPGMAVAMITTLYGAVLANVVCIPFTEKLNYLHRQEMLAMETILRGLLCIRDGESPRVIEQKLSVFITDRKAA